MNLLKKLQEITPEAEIWWDSSPLIFEKWSESIIKKTSGSKKESWSHQLKKFYNPYNVNNSLIRGVTTNPSLCYQVIQSDPPYWSELVDNLIKGNPGLEIEDIYWMTYKKIIKEGAKSLYPMWEKSNGKYGWVSAQVDPRHIFNYEKMLHQGLELTKIYPNVMVKVPGSKEGYMVIEELTAKGVSINNTLCFTVPQAVACANAFKSGLKQAKKKNIDLSRWRSVITHMTSRFGNQEDLLEQAEARGIKLNENDIRQSENAIAKKIYQLIRQNNYPTKLLLSSMRTTSSPGKDSVICWHLEKTSGGKIVYTCPPSFINQLLELEDNSYLFEENAIDEPINSNLMTKLIKIPYFAKSYETDQMLPEEFNYHAALIETAAEFSRQTRRMIDFISRRFEGLNNDPD